MWRCTICQRYRTIVKNAEKVRSISGTAPGVEMSRDDFHAWAQGAPRACYACQIPEQLVRYLGAKTQVGHDLQRLGVDRLDNDRGYAADNLGWCCFPCNKAKSNSFTADEMSTFIGPGIAKIWQARLAKRGVAWSSPSIAT